MRRVNDCGLRMSIGGDEDRKCAFDMCIRRGWGEEMSSIEVYFLQN